MPVLTATNLRIRCSMAWTIAGPGRSTAGAWGWVAAFKRVRAGGWNTDHVRDFSLVRSRSSRCHCRNPLKGLKPEQFSCPARSWKIFVDPSSPVAYAMKEEASAVYLQ